MDRRPVPVAPAFVGWWAAALGGGVTALALAGAPWQELAGCFGGSDACSEAAIGFAWRGLLVALGAAAGVVLGHRVLGAWGRGERLRPPRRPGLLALAGAVLAGAAAPGALAAAAKGDVGRVVLYAPLVAAALGALATLPAALTDRARARAALARVEEERARRRASGA